MPNVKKRFSSAPPTGKVTTNISNLQLDCLHTSFCTPTSRAWIDVKIEDMPKKIEELLDRRQMAGPLSLDQIACAVENGSCITAMANNISALMRMVQQNTVRLAAAAAPDSRACQC
jgi:hypothetical protein